MSIWDDRLALVASMYAVRWCQRCASSERVVHLWRGNCAGSACGIEESAGHGGVDADARCPSCLAAEAEFRLEAELAGLQAQSAMLQVVIAHLQRMVADIEVRASAVGRDRAVLALETTARKDGA